MFNLSKEVPCFINSFASHGDSDHPELKMTFHIVPFNRPLARDISESMADCLFSKNEAGDWAPRVPMNKANFSDLNVQMQHVEFYSTPGARIIEKVENVHIANLRATQADSESWRLEFEATMLMTEPVLDLAKRFFRSVCFLTMEEVQRELTETQDEEAAETTSALQGAADDAPAEKPKRGRKKKGAEDPAQEPVTA